jgi:hypothetical protein
MGLLLAAAFLLGSVAQKHGPPVPRLIIDTDIGGGGCNDVDDVVAVWCVRQCASLSAMARMLRARPSRVSNGASQAGPLSEGVPASRAIYAIFHLKMGVGAALPTR